MFNYVHKELVPDVNLQSELKELKYKHISNYTGRAKDKLVYVNLANSNDIIVYDLTKCSKSSYRNFIAVLRRCLN